MPILYLARMCTTISVLRERSPFRQKDDPEVVLENYVDDTHGFMRVEIDDETITARYIAVPRPHDPPETPPRVADLFQLQYKPNKLIR